MLSDGVGWWRMVADGCGWWRMMADGGGWWRMGGGWWRMVADGRNIFEDYLDKHALLYNYIPFKIR